MTISDKLLRRLISRVRFPSRIASPCSISTIIRCGRVTTTMSSTGLFPERRPCFGTIEDRAAEQRWKVIAFREDRRSSLTEASDDVEHRVGGRFRAGTRESRAPSNRQTSPAREMPAEFGHLATGSAIRACPNGSSRANMKYDPMPAFHCRGGHAARLAAGRAELRNVPKNANARTRNARSTAGSQRVVISGACQPAPAAPQALSPSRWGRRIGVARPGSHPSWIS